MAHKAYTSYKWGRVRKEISKNNNICATDSDGNDHTIQEEQLPDDIRSADNANDEYGDSYLRYVSDEYSGMLLCFKKRGRSPSPLANPKLKQKQIPDELSGPVYLPDSGEIVELDELNEEEWEPPETNRKSKIEWDGSEQNIESNESKKRERIFGSNLDNKNDLL